MGCGAICYDSMENVKLSFSIRLSDEISVFIAEAQALLLAIKKIYHEDHEIFIFTDSRSVLIALESCNNQTSIINKIKTLLKEENNIKLCWVKAHVGTMRNEAAELLIKEATKRILIDREINYSKNWLKNKLKAYSLKLWQHRWENSRNQDNFLVSIQK
ncbi:hypothetical protein AVEN_143274-1 [Araneus ventricosus]|uniref:RNase H type-1 domain-containing protein n=1 Tax=Araneus ventricosus TaxID=182803 RepID=A0A4Y2AFD5_ARAVE|nr:hypothetical protein AVEN_143274-1 [Araneus ventricosus]